MDRIQLTDQHSFANDTVFRFKTLVLVGKRMIQNLISPKKRFKDKGQLIDHPVISFSESELWNPNDNKDNWILTVGKIENLRIAAAKLNGSEVKANEVFSFWRHIGNPNFGKDYVVGREIREGCIVPTIAGGLCQLSNALYDAALKANFDIIERHKHTRVIQGSLAELDRDATVKWNYVDLRFKSGFDFRIEIELSSDKLFVTFKSEQKNLKSEQKDIKNRQSNKLNDCYSCGNFSCYKHPDRSTLKQEIASTSFILDEKWPEYDKYLTTIAAENDHFIVPIKKGSFFTTDRYSWTAIRSRKLKTTTLQGIYRAAKLRFVPKNKNNVFELGLKLDKKIAKGAVKKIPLESTHIVVSQNLLPFLYETGALGGRTYDVLMNRLPFEKLHERLDMAYSIYPESKTLNDFRASKRLIDLENKALTKARKVITPHSYIAEIFRNKVEKLNWILPVSNKEECGGNKILFPASALARKGAYEIRRLAEELKLDLLVPGKAIEEQGFWKDIKVETFNGDYSQIALVVYPTYIEHQPRAILKAISKGIPIITTAACGIENSDKVSIVEFNNFEQLKAEVLKHLNNN